MPLILGTNSIKDTGYDVDNSLRFNDGSSDYLSRTPGSTGNTKKFTVSFWLKRGTITGADQNIFHAYPGSGSRSQILFNSSEQLLVDLEAGNTNRLITTRVFRDTSAWYHIVIVYDSDNGTSGDRVIIYINGVRETNFGTETYPSSGSTSQINTTTQHEISSYDGSGSYFDGYLAEFVLLDGTVADATSFGEFDEDSPTIWKPKNVSGLSFGTNGFYLDFENSGALGADVSGNSNNFTVNNLTSVDQSTDTCTNNFCTLNPLNFGNGTLSEGNLKWTTSSQAGNLAFGTIGIDMDVSNQFYWETKIDSIGGGVVIGIAPTTLRWNDTSRAGSYGYYSDGNKYSGTSASSYGASFTNNDIIGILAGNGTITFYKNGSTQGTAFSSLTGTWLPFLAEVGHTNSMNFGSPPYSISSGNSDPAGYGNFEHSTNGGYALNTKNLAEFG
jgi:hypothetical protein